MEMKRLKDLYKKIFSNNDPFNNVFNNYIEKKILIFPTKGYYLSKDQYDNLIKVLDFFLEKEIFISEIENGEESFENTVEYCFNHNRIELKTSYEEYLKIPVFLENILYSTTAKWGMMISHENHALLGGSSKFIEKFLENYSYLEDKEKFLRYWHYNKQNYNSDLNWQKEFFKYYDV